MPVREHGGGNGAGAANCIVECECAAAWDGQARVPAHCKTGGAAKAVPPVLAYDLVSAASSAVFLCVALDAQCEDHAEDQSCGDAEYDETFLLCAADLKVGRGRGYGCFFASGCQILFHLLIDTYEAVFVLAEKIILCVEGVAVAVCVVGDDDVIT